MARSTFTTLAATFLLLIGACGDNPASPPAGPGGDTDLDVAAVLADYATGDVGGYEASLHDEFRFLRPGAGASPYARAQEVVLCAAMHGGEAGASGAILQGAELVRLDPTGDWAATDRDDLLGAHRSGARKRTYQITLRFTFADSAAAWEVAGLITAFADSAGGRPRLLGVVDHTGQDSPGWYEVRRLWAEPELPDLPGTPDLLSMRWIAAHDGRDWLRMGELLHPGFRYHATDGEVTDRAEELATFADLMAGRPSRDSARLLQLDVQDWEHTEGPWNPVSADDPHFGDVPGAVAQWLDIRIVYTTTAGEVWLVDGLVRMAALESERGWQMLGFIDGSEDTGEPGSLGWSAVRARYR